MKNPLYKRIMDISFRKHLGHVGSCLTAVNIIDSIYQKMNVMDKFVLSSGHAGLALYVILEKYFGINAEYLFEKHGVHPNRDEENHISCAAGSLGQGLPVALGMAIADPKIKVHCLISDGECAEGSIWEALAIKSKYKVKNLKVYVNANRWGAYDPIDIDVLEQRLIAFDPSIQITRSKQELLMGQEAHYRPLEPNEYRRMTKELEK